MIDSANFRDLGGVAASGGQTLRPGVLLRSAMIAADDLALVSTRSANGLAVVDLRSESERARDPSALAGMPGIRLAHHDLLAALPAGAGPWPVLAASPTPAGARDAMLALYRAMPAAAGPAVVAIMRTVVADGEPLLVHCTAGKDRTGVVVALLLSALGTPRDAIQADYLISQGVRSAAAVAATKAMVEERIGQSVDVPVVEVLMGVHADYLDAALAVVAARGGTEAYLSDFGADPALFAAFRERLVV